MDFWIPHSVLRFAVLQALRPVRNTLWTRQTLGKLKTSGKTDTAQDKMELTNVQLILRCGVIHSQIWQTFSGGAAQLTTEVSHQRWKSAARLGRGTFERSQDSCMRYQRDLKEHDISSSTSSPPPFPRGSSPKCHCLVPGQVTKEQLAQGTCWHNSRSRPKPPTAQSSVSATIPSCFVLSRNGASCPAHLHVLQVHTASPQLTWMKPEERANIC